eukprot:gnl/MRDRNA2_/MRDRNA2_127063_c0_seq1.p1 gnl/MRDRNA2_/MRDRNA2_127063_c0~~gnl/MRDRNA2_/MRDRNA2_127063_c0_seq1.p1  ORF type:complete len:227 (+),score=38.39 gnl/MRDRNA2_/MRDRNA2_127063_c0_seq1:121-801(+)
MLQLFKNQVVTETGLSQADIRQAELDYYINNYWTWGGTATIMGGFVFAQLTNPVPEDTNKLLEAAYLISTTACMGLNLCVITWTVLCCVWGPGMALRGPEGLESFNKTIEFLKSEQEAVYWAFTFGVIFYFIATCTLVWVYPSRASVNMASCGVLAAFLVVVLVYQFRIDAKLKISGGAKNATDGKIASLAVFNNVADLDNVAATNRRDSSFFGTAHVPGTHNGNQ